MVNMCNLMQTLAGFKLNQPDMNLWIHRINRFMSRSIHVGKKTLSELNMSDIFLKYT